MRETIEAVLETYKERLTTRLHPLILRNFNDFLPKFVAQMHLRLMQTPPIPYDNSLFPEGCKFYWRNGTSCQVVVEQKPQVRTIKLLTNGEEKSFPYNFNETYRLAFPYVSLIFNFFYNSEKKLWIRNGTFAAFANKPLRKITDVVYEPALSNINDHEVCSGKDFHTYGSIADQVDAAVGHFWQGTFTTDWCGNFTGNPFGTVADWERVSYDDPLAALKVEWIGGKTLLDVLGKATLKHDKIVFSAASYTPTLLKEAATAAWKEVTEECKGVDVAALDSLFIDDLITKLKL